MTLITMLIFWKSSDDRPNSGLDKSPQGNLEEFVVRAEALKNMRTKVLTTNK